MPLTYKAFLDRPKLVLWPERISKEKKVRITEVGNTDTKSMFQVLTILEPLLQKVMKKPPARKQEGNGISGNNYLKQRSLTFPIAFGHLATLRLRGNLKVSQISLDIFT